MASENKKPSLRKRRHAVGFTPLESAPGGLTWIYISGAGRSGSTLLDRLLGSDPQFFSTGELGRLQANLKRNAMCGCGMNLTECSVWSAITMDLTRKSRQRPQDLEFGRFERWTNLPRALIGLHPSDTSTSYGQFWTAFDRIVREQQQVAFVVDSSKTVTDFGARPFLLRDLAEVDLRSIHLVRDGRGVVWSKIKAEQRRRRYLTAEAVEAARRDLSVVDLDRLRRWVVVLRGSLSWVTGNTLAFMLRKRLPKGASIVLTYEELAKGPDRTLRRIGEWLGVKLEIDSVANHLIAGNRMRHLGILQIRPDRSWEENLTLLERATFWTIAWPWGLWHRRQVLRATTDE